MRAISVDVPEAAVTTFTTVEVCAATGLSYRKLDYWDRNRTVKPSGRPAHGTGSSRGYTAEDLFHLLVVRDLTDAGVSLQRASDVVGAFRRADDFEPDYIVVDRQGVNLAGDLLALAEDIHAAEWPVSIVVNLRAVRAERDRILDEHQGVAMAQ